MAWAMSRQTTKPQEQAYCLLGLLDVSMKPNYNETVEVAFIRLVRVLELRYDRTGMLLN